MLGFYLLREDPDANVIIALLQLGFLKVMTYAILLISPEPQTAGFSSGELRRSSQ